MKYIIEKILALFAKIVLAIHKPMIIGITGSVGKSSTKEAVRAVLSNKMKVRASPGNLNSQIGLPLAVLGFEKAGSHKKNLSSAFEWLTILIIGFFRIFQFAYPRTLILEMGTDRPGDIRYLLSIVGHLDIAIITDIGISHLEFFANPAELAAEKLSLLSGLTKNGLAILNADNPKVMQGKTKTKNDVLSFGLSSGADITAQDIVMTIKNNQLGLGFKVNYQGNRVPFFIPQSLGKPTAYAVLAAVATGLRSNMNLVDISQALENYSSPAGRLKLIEGMNDTKIIDDTYNAAPSSTIAALEVLHDLPGQRKIAALGHMAELGAQSEASHREVAAKAVELGVNLIFLVGEKTRDMQDELTNRKFSGQVFWADDSDVCAAQIIKKILPGDLVLVKGSQSARMEKVVKKLMKNPIDAGKLLVRQSSQWQNS
jgi:UDP-N-acetylmuramyl pentapeptide synthase